MDLSNYYGYSDYYTTAQSNNMTGTLAFSVVICILAVIGLWKMFVKAGEEGWKSIIPFYNMYILFKIAGRNFWKYLIIAIVLVICFYVTIFGTIGTVVGALGGSSSIANGLGSATMIASVLSLVFGIWLFVEYVFLCDAISKSFGHGIGFAAGLFFLGPIFLIILGFNGDEYVGNNSNAQQ